MLILTSSGPSIKPWVLRKILFLCAIFVINLYSLFLPYEITIFVCYICYRSLLVVSSLRDNYELILLSLSQNHKHVI